MAKIPPPSVLSKQCANIFFTFPANASCEIMDEFACPKPSMPSSASEDEPSSPDCLAPHLSHKRQVYITSRKVTAIVDDANRGNHIKNKK